MASARAASFLWADATSSAVRPCASSASRCAACTAAMAADTVCWIASMTKAVTTTAALQQVEKGRLALDTPIGAVLPDLAKPLVL